MEYDQYRGPRRISGVTEKAYTKYRVDSYGKLAQGISDLNGASKNFLSGRSPMIMVLLRAEVVIDCSEDKTQDVEGMVKRGVREGVGLPVILSVDGSQSCDH